MEPLRNKLILCSESYSDSERFRTFGSLLVKECEINLRKFLSKDYTMFFYELFLYNPKTFELIDIPVMIHNIPNPKSEIEGNKENSNTSPENWILTRRFFIVDNISGLQTLNSFKNGGDIPIAIRFPKLIKMVILLQNTAESKIMLPYFEILYKSKLTSLLENFPTSTVKFISEYKMDISNFKDIMLGIFLALNFIVLCMGVTKMYAWYKLNPPQLSPVIRKIFNYFLIFLFFSYKIS